MNIILVLSVLAAVLGLTAMVMEFRRSLMMLQQNSYRNDRYSRYLRESGDSTDWMKLGALAVLFIVINTKVPTLVSSLLMVAYFTLICVRLWRRKYKKPLVWTRRVWRIFVVMAVLAVLVMLPFAILVAKLRTVELIAFYMASELLLVYDVSAWLARVANWLLRPVERKINQGYIDDAARILASMPDLKVVGITGSYGKTSTKHYLNRILSEKLSVCMTPGSYNTTMGVVRTIREYLQPYNEVFIVEMGAKQPGDIKEICDLVHPSVGIITAVGEQHLESFKSIENVQRTKFELVDALPSGGLAVVNDDFPFVANRKVDNVAVVRYGVEPRDAVQFYARDVEYSVRGTEFTVVHPAGELRLRTRLVGECNISNLLAAVAVALYLGVSDDKIRYAVEKIEQVEHRLNVKRTPGGLTIIDDAFNSNPAGSAMALDVLAAMTPGKRIVITPGMIELGDRQEELNRAFGEKIAASADVAVVVGRYNRDAILAGIGENPAIEVHAVDTFADAQRLLGGIAGAGDTVLYENDLPDTFK